MTNKKILIPAITAFTFVLGLGVFMTATSAQESEESNSLFDRVASILNIERDDLQNAFNEAAVDGVEERVANGDITEERGDEIISRIEEDGFQIRGNKGGHQKGGQLLETASEYLGIEVSEIRESLRNGETPAEVIEANGGDVDEVKELVISEMEEKINSAVDEGKITAEEAAEKLENADERIDAFLAGERPSRG